MPRLASRWHPYCVQGHQVQGRRVRGVTPRRGAIRGGVRQDSEEG